MKFVVDRMLGKLARRLRMLGCDSLYPPERGDSDLIRIARREGRTLLTRDTHLQDVRGVKVFLVSSQEVREQLLEILSAFGLPPGERSRCTLCNGALQETSREEARDRVPDFVHRQHAFFYHCPGCGKFYWQGTHWRELEREAGTVRD